MTNWVFPSSAQKTTNTLTREASGFPSNPQKEGEPPTGSDCFLVFLAEDNIERTCEELKRRGVNFLGPIQDEPFGRIAEFRDPDNKPLYIWEPPKRGSPKFPGVASLVEHYERVRNRLRISEIQHSTI